MLCLVLTGCFEAPCEAVTEPGRPPIPCVAPAVVDAGQPGRPFDAGRPVDAGQPLDAGREVDAGRVDAGVDAGVRDAGVSTSDAGVRVIDLGVVITNDAGLSSELTFDVAASDEGFLIELIGVQVPPLTELQADAIRNPRGTTLALGRNDSLHLSRSRADTEVQAALVLESDDARAEFMPGTFRFRVASRDERGRARGGVSVAVRVFVKPRPPPGPQRLALNLFFSGSAGLTAATAPTQARLQQGLRGFRDLYADAGITLEAPRLFDLPPGFSAVTSMFDVDGGSRMGTSAQSLVRQSAAAPQGMNLFFVETLSLDPRLPPGAVLGVAGGRPGTTMTQGTSASGVIVLFDAATFVPRRPGDVDPLPIVLAHEVGHQLGLSHVFEVNGEADNMSDTPMEGEFNADANLMTPFANNQGLLSPLQKTGLRRNPVVRP